VTGQRHTVRLRTAAAAALLMAAGPLAGCTLPPAGPSDSSATPSVSSNLAKVTVTPPGPDKPTVSVPTPFSVRSSTRRVLVQGSGAPVQAGQRVTVDYLGLDGTDGHEILSSYGGKSPSFLLDPKQAMPGIVTTLVGVPVGSRVLAALPPQDAYGVQGQPAAGIAPSDTILVLLDVKAARDVLTRATGTVVPPRAGLPTVRSDAAGRPTVTLPKGAPPAKLVVQPLVQGRGPAVQRLQQVQVHYAGVVWPGGREFDSSWRRGSPASFTVGRGEIVAGLDRALVGRPVGSRLLVVVPPDDGYGAAGNEAFGVKGTDTLVFVVDLLDAG
jgi:peptidylprolyl isomerase